MKEEGKKRVDKEEEDTYAVEFYGIAQSPIESTPVLRWTVLHNRIISRGETLNRSKYEHVNPPQKNEA